MKSLFAMLVLGLALTGCASAPRQAAAPKGPLILISIDGFRADYLGRGHTPTLAALAAGGVTTDAMRPSFPPVTFPNHYTVVTGLRPDHHGIVDNSMVDAARPGEVFTMATKDRFWWDDGEPIWVTAERAGLKTATLFWPGSEVDVHGVRPTRWLPFNYQLPNNDRVDQVLAWLDDPAYAQPAFMTLYFDVVDSAGHAAGADDNPALAAALASVDSAIARLKDGLAARGLSGANLVIVADHGMAATSPDRIVWLDDLADLGKVKVVTQYTSAGLAPLPGHEAEVEARVVGHHDHAECWRKDRIPARLHYGTHRRIPPILCLADPGWLLLTRESAAKRPPKGGGAHGYDPNVPEMAALFIANGPAFRSGVMLRPFDNVDIYPLMAKVLGLNPLENDGRLIEVAGALK